MANPSVTYGAILGFQDGSGNFVPVSAATPLPTTAGMFEAGSGFGSVQQKGIKYAGQVTFTNGSADLVGIGTDFLNEEIDGLSYWYEAWVVDSAGNFYFIGIDTITDNTHAAAYGFYDGGHSSGNYSVTYPGVSGTYDLYLSLSVAASDSSSALGYNSVASGINSTANGINSTASGNSSTVVGINSTASGTGSTASGSSSTASGSSSTAIGNTVIASGVNTTAIGYNVIASADGSTAIGNGLTNNVANTVALGSGSIFVRATTKRLEVLGADGDVVLASPNGTRYKITVSDIGVLTVTAL